MADSTTTARIRLALEGASTVQQGLAGVESKIGDLRGSVVGLAGGLSAAGFASWIKGAIDAADETGKMAQKTGLLTKEVAGLQLAFDQGGAGDKMQATLARLAKEASSGNEAFKAMGITVAGTDGKLKSTRALLGEVSDKFAGYRDGAEKTALAQELFGKSGADIIPVLNGGATALADYDAKAQALGLTLDDETTKAAEQFNDQMDIVMQRTQGVARQIAGELMPVLSAVSAEFARASEKGSAMSVTGQFLSTVIETVTVVGANLSFVLQTLARDGAAIYNVYASIAKLDFDGMRKGVAAYKTETLAARAELDAFERRVLQARKINESLKGASDLDEPAVKRAKAAAALAIENAKNKAEEERRKKAIEDEKRRFAALSGQRSAAKALTEAEKELVEVRKRDIAVGVLRNKQAEENYKAQLQAAEVESQFRQIVIDKEREWDETANEEKLKATREILEKQQKETEDFWSSVDSTAHDVFVSVATEGEDAFKRIGKTLKAAVLDMLYQMTIKKWLFQISGVNVGGGSGGFGLSDIASAYSAYSNAASGGAAATGAAGSASALGAWSGGTMSGANAFGSIAANSTGTGISGLLATNGAYGTAASASSAAAAASSEAAAAAAATAAEASAAAAASSSTAAGTGAAASGGMSGLAATGWGALIVAAIVSANNLYKSGYTREALSSAGTTRTFGNASQTTGMGTGGNSGIYNNSTERLNRSILDAVGISDKWSDILSGTTRMASLFGRKLAAYGFAVDVAGSTSSVKGYESYRGGLFRSDKNRTFDVDPGDQKMVQNMVAQTRAAAIETARAAGLSTSAIENWNGQIRINFKNTTTAAEQSERYNKALNEVFDQMIKSAQKATFDADIARQVEAVRARAGTMAAALGLSTKEIENFNGSLGVSMKEMDGSEAAARKLGKASEDLYFQMLQGTTGFNMTREKFGEFMKGIDASAEAVGISSKGMADIIAQGMMGRMSQSQVGEALGEMVIGGVYNMIVSPFASQIAQAFMGQIIQPMIVAVTTGGSISTAVSQASIQSVVATANAAASQLSAILADPGFRAAMAGVQQAIGGIASASVKPAANIRAYGSAVSASGAAANAAASQVKSAWRSISDSIIDEIRRIRGEILGTSAAGEAYNLARFTTATAAARAGSRSAAEMLPELGRSVLEMAQETASSRSDLNAMRGQILESLELTNALIAKKYKFSVPAFADGGYHAGGLRLVGERGPEIEATGPARYWDASRTQEMMGAGNNAALIAEIRALRSEVASLRSEAKRSADADALTADNIDGLVRQKYKLKTVAA